MFIVIIMILIIGINLILIIDFADTTSGLSQDNDYWRLIYSRSGDR